MNIDENWNDFKSIKPSSNGYYRVKNQYHQSCDALWNGIFWENRKNYKGNLMQYSDETILFWRDNGNKAKL